jgi:hypothetical protein
MIIAGIDYSLSGPAVCYYDTKKPLEFSSCRFFYVHQKQLPSLHEAFPNIIGISYPKYEHEISRYEQLARSLLSRETDCWQYYIEDYSYGSVGKVFTIAENVGILKYMIKKMRAEYTMLAPCHVKKNATGKGNANKLVMHETFVKEHNINMDEWNKYKGKSPLADIIDSYYVLKTGLSHDQTPG